MDVLWRTQARADLTAQIAVIAADRPAAAARLNAQVLERVGMLVDFPDIGRPSTRPNIRELVIPRTPYVVIYERRPSSIIILRVFHGRQAR